MVGRLRRVANVSRPRTVGPITAGHGVNEFFSIVIPPIIPLLVTDLGITYGQAGLLLTIFFVMYSVFQLPAGMLADWIGKRRLLIAGLFGMAGSILLASLAGSYWALLFAQSVAGISGSTFHPTGMSIISDVETTRTEGRAMGVFGFGGALGTLSSPLIVGGLAAIAGWRAALIGAALLGGTMTVVIVFLFSNEDDDVSNTDKDDSKIDKNVSGIARRTRGQRSSSRGGVRAVRNGLPAVRNSLPSIQNVIRSIRGGSRTTKEAVGVPLDRGIVLLFSMTFVLSLQHRAIQTFTTAYVTEQTGASVSAGNLIFFTLLLGGSLASLWAGSLADRFSRELLGVVASIGTAVLVGTTLLVTQLLTNVPFELLLGVLAIWFAVIGVGMYASYPIKNALVSERADAAYSGSLFGIIQTASAMGSASGPALFGVLATEWGVIAAFPAIAGVSVVLAALFALLLRTE